MLKHSLALFSLFTSLALSVAQAQEEDGWVPLFDGKSLEGWKSNEEAPNAFTVEDGAIKVGTGRAHLFYVGDVNGADFKNFEFKAKVKTTKGSNGGIYFHTEYQEEGWPEKGYECQVNTSHSDRRKTGSLYAIQDVLDDAPSKDDEWFDYYIKVEGKNIIIKINDKEVVNYTEKEDSDRPDNFKGRALSSGTFGIQGHDPDSVTYIKDIQVKVLE